MPEDFFSKFKTMKREWKIAFLSAVIIGFLTHMFVFTNLLVNHDGLINIYSSQLRFTSGRFFLGLFSGISSYFNLPWIIGLLSILYLSLTAVALVEIFELRKSPAIIIVAGLIVTFPTVASTFSYMFTADGYMVGILLAVLAVLITKKYKFGFLPASLILYLSVGIYQANITITLTIVIIWFIQELANNQMKLKPLFLLLARYVSTTALGMLFYAITFKAYQNIFAGKITNYQGLDKVGQNEESISDLLTTINEATQEFFFRGFVTDFPVNLFEYLNVLLVVLIVVGLVIAVVKHKVYLSPIRILFILISIYLLPVFSFILYFVSPAVQYHMLMVMALVMVYILPVVIYDKLSLRSLSVQGFSWGTVIILLLIVFNFSIINNIAYLNMTYKQEKSYALMNRMLDRMEQTEGYENVSKIAILGRLDMETGLATKIVPNNIPAMTGAMGDTFLVEPYHFNAMLANHFGVKFKSVKTEQLNLIQELGVIDEMKPWPSKDSVQVVDDVIIIKLS